MRNVTVSDSVRLADKRYYPGAAVVSDAEATALDDANFATDDSAYSLVDPDAEPVAKSVSLLKTAAAPVTVLPAVDYNRLVTINVVVVTTFAAGDGAAPIFDIGETDTLEKFKANLNTGTALAVNTYSGILSAGKALIVTPTAATGTTSAGAIDVNVIAVPAS